MTSTQFKQQCFVFDIDGTLADHHGVRGPFDEDKVDQDRPIIPTITVLRALQHAGYYIIFLSGRTDGCREATLQWLKKQVVGVFDFDKMKLFMRKKGDYRKDSIIKKEIYDTEILPKFDVIGVFDDRLQVCRMLYDEGLFCFNVNQGLKEF